MRGWFPDGAPRPLGETPCLPAGLGLFPNPIRPRTLRPPWDLCLLPNLPMRPDPSSPPPAPDLPPEEEEVPAPPAQRLLLVATPFALVVAMFLLDRLLRG